MWQTLVVFLWWCVVGVFGGCEPIRIEMCRGLGYNVTAMPNLVGHEIQGDADFTLQTFSPLIQYGCSAQLHLFLCSVYAPMCTDKVPGPIGPCRGLCEQVRSRCLPVLRGFGFPWPAALNCSKFPPENNHHHMCMEGPGEPGPASAIQAIGAGPLSCARYNKPGLYIFLNRSGRCAASCGADILWSQKDKRVTEAWMAAFVTISLVSAGIAVCGLMRPRQETLNTAEKAIGFLTVCHAAVSVGYVIRLAAGRVAVACTQAIPIHTQEQVMMGQQQQQYLTQDGLSNPYCATVFLLLYYFGNAASVWWVVVCAWWCVAARNWNPCEDSFGFQQGFSTLGSITAWGIPAAFTIAVLVTRDVDADELTGTCYVGQQSTRSLLLLVLVPQLLYHLSGTIFLSLGLVSLFLPPPMIPAPALTPLHQPTLLRQRESPKNSLETQQRRKSLAGRVGIFAWLYCLAGTVVTGGLMYEWWGREAWLKAPEPSTIPTPSHRPLLQLFLLRLVSGQLLVVFSSCWVWWPGFVTVWKRVGTCKQPPNKCQNVVQCYGAGHIGRLGQQHNGGVSNRGYKKCRKHRKYHSGSETQV